MGVQPVLASKKDATPWPGPDSIVMPGCSWQGLGGMSSAQQQCGCRWVTVCPSNKGSSHTSRLVFVVSFDLLSFIHLSMPQTKPTYSTQDTVDDNPHVAKKPSTSPPTWLGVCSSLPAKLGLFT